MNFGSLLKKQQQAMFYKKNYGLLAMTASPSNNMAFTQISLSLQAVVFSPMLGYVFGVRLTR
jgi:hypothetical protein